MYNIKKAAAPYVSSLKEYDPSDPRSVHWGTRQTQYFRFKVLVDIAPFLNDKDCVVFDYGCGVGDLYEYLRFQGFRGRYVGVDINKAAIDAAKEQFADKTVEFDSVRSPRDLNRWTYDYCLMSGVFNFDIEGTEAEMKKTLRDVFKQARKGVAYNGLSTFAKAKDKALFYVDPFKLSAWCMQNITPYVALRHEYRGGNFTLYLYRDSGVDF